MKEAEQAKRNAETKSAAEEVVTLKPNFHGVGVDLKALGRKIWRKMKKQREKHE